MTPCPASGQYVHLSILRRFVIPSIAAPLLRVTDRSRPLRAPFAGNERYIMSTNFEELGLAAPILKALVTEGYTTPTPIQTQAIPHVMQGRDVQGIAQTGTGKTAAFALPILQRLLADKKQRQAPQGLPCVGAQSPTRELASQIAESFRAYGRHTGAAHRADVRRRAERRARCRHDGRAAIDILVATPGRLLDHMQ